MTTKAHQKAAERAEAIETLRKSLKPRDTVYTILRHVSRSGMSRSISAVIVRDGEIVEIDWLVCRILGLRFDSNNGGAKLSGCGMDMGFHLVYELGSALWPDGTPEPHSYRNGEPDTHGGYALNHRWI